MYTYIRKFFKKHMYTRLKMSFCQEQSETSPAFCTLLCKNTRLRNESVNQGFWFLLLMASCPRQREFMSLRNT